MGRFNGVMFMTEFQLVIAPRFGLTVTLLADSVASELEIACGHSVELYERPMYRGGYYVG